jgi:hypothetical protein
MFTAWGNKIRLTLKQWFVTALEDARDWLEDRLAGGSKKHQEAVERDLIEVLHPLVTKLLDSGTLSPELTLVMEDFLSGKHQAGELIGAAVSGSAVSGTIGGFMAPVLRGVEYFFNSKIPNKIWDLGLYLDLYRFKGMSYDLLKQYAKMMGYDETQVAKLLDSTLQVLSPDNLTELYIRKDITEAAWTQVMTQHGYNSDQMAGVLLLKKSLVDVNNTRDAWLRGYITEAEHDERLLKLGTKESEIPLIKSLYSVLPGVQDLIAMAVKEVFTPEIAEKYGQFRDFPPAFGLWAKVLGLSETWAQAYWAAHWKLPGTGDAYEMLHRGIITSGQQGEGSNEFDDLLRALDIMPFWREKMKLMSYNLLSRIDLRRMLQMGILSPEQVFQGYRKLGYTDEDAGYQTAFAVAGASETEKDLTRADLLGAYDDGTFTRRDVGDMLVKLGYDPLESETLLLKVDYDKAKAKRKADAGVVETYFKKGFIDENTARTRLSALGLLAGEVDVLLVTWTPVVKVRAERATKAELEAFFKAKIVSEGEYVLELKSLGYADKYIYWNLLAVKGEKKEVNKELNKTDIIAAYKAEVFDRSMTKNILMSVGYDEFEAEVLLTTVDNAAILAAEKKVKA